MTIDQTTARTSESSALGNSGNWQRRCSWLRTIGLKPWSVLLLPLAGLLVGGCPRKQDSQDSVNPQAPQAIQPRIKASGGQTINVPARPPQPPATVAIIKDNSLNYSSMVSQALDAALGPGGIANLVHSGDTVLIKPNLVTSSANAVTDWHIVQALVDLIKAVNGGASITIADGSATQDTINSVMVNQGYTAANFPGVTFANFNDNTTNPTNTYVLADSRTGASEQIPALITNATVYIDMPKMKTHYHAGMTGAVKNLGIGTGPLPLWTITGGSAKAGLHHDIRSEIVDHIACRVPDLTIMDALQAMQGQGPASGTMVTMNLVLASKDPVAVDAVAATIMGIPPYLITHLVFAANENIGVIDLNNITTTGNITLAAASAIHTFVRATPGNLQGPTEPGVIPYRATTVIRTAPSAMTIDGDLSEWGYANSMVADASYQVKGSASGWGGAADSSFTAQVLYDTNNLYLAVKVKDNVKLANSNTGSAIVNGDGVELYLSTYLEQYNTTRSASYGSAYDYHLAISYADAPQAYMLSHSRALTGAVLSKVETSDGYIIEALIPWSNFGSPTVTPVSMSGGYTQYRQLGLNIAVNDADSNPSTVDHKLIWNNATDSDIETNPIKIGMSYVDPPGGLYPTLYFTLTTSATNGTVTKSPDQATYAAGSAVVLTATPATGYVFTSWSGSVAGSANPLSVTMDGKKTITANFLAAPVLTSISVSPANISVNAGGAQPFTAIAYDQNNNPLSPQPSFTWSVNGGGAIDGNGLFTAGASAGGPFTVTAQSGSVSGSATVLVTVSNSAPTVVNAAAATPNPVTGTTVSLSVLGDDDGGESNLTYTWSTTGTPPATVTFSVNGTNAAKNATATFTKAGTYTFQVIIADLGNLTTTSSVAVSVNQTVTTIVVAPTTATVNVSATQQYTATARDQFTTALAPQPTFTWTVSGGGSIGTSGLFTAGTAGGGPYTVTAQSGSVSGTASVTVSSTPTAVYRIDCGSTSVVSPFTADQYSSGGTQRTVTNTITTSGVTNPAPAAVYQSERYGNSTYTLPNLTAGSQYTVRLHFAELYQTATGKRVFNVAINSTTVLSNFDIYATAGGNYKAVVREFTATANASGQIVIQLTTVTDNATIEGIEILTSTPNSAPSIVTAAAASPNPVAGSTVALSVLGADDGGESNLTYSWATTGTPPAAVTFSANGTNAAKASTATFTKAGTYAFQVTVKDQGGLTATNAVSVVVNATLTSIVVSPSSTSVKTSATQQFTATARDQFATSLVTQPTFTWTVSGGGTIGTSGFFTAGTSAGGPYTVTATSGGVGGTASVTVSAVSSTVYQIDCGSTSAVSPFTADQYGSGGTQHTVTNTITTSGVTNPAPAAVYQSERYGNSTYTLPNLTAGSQYTVRLHFAELYQTATGKRVFNVAINGSTVLSNFDIYATAGGNYKAVVREFTATANASGQIVIQLTTVTDNATIEGIEILTSTPNSAPSIVTAAAALPNPVTGSTVALSVLGADDGGESNLTYAWATTGTPPAAVTFSANGSNAAKASTATFTKAGTYAFQVTVKDQGGLTVTSAVSVVVNATLTSIVVSPSSASVNTSATQQFTATARDQFATNLATQPTFTWTVTGGGTISTSGMFTAGISGGGPYTVTAKSGSVSGTASVTVSAVLSTVYQINCGSSSAVSPFSADQYGSGGTQRTVTNTITISGVTNPAPAAVYQSERYGNSTYTLPNLTASSQYTVRLHFAELYQTATGKRVFNVAINGTTVLSNFDIYATAGGNYKAVVREFTATSNSSGQIVIQLTTVTDNATIEGIEIIK